MAATNYTPIQLYYSTTASTAPVAGNLTSGELAINITDGKLYYKDNGGVVQVMATKGTGSIGGATTQIQYNNAGALAGNAAMTFNSGTSTTTLTTLNLTNALGATYGGTAQSAYTQGDFLYASATNTLSKLGIGTVNYILTSTGSVPQWVAPTSVTVQTANNLAGGLVGSVPYQSAADTTTFLAIGAANRIMSSSGTAPQWVTALTGLTGVSSSSITNTSLTSGRVVISSTAGLEADSANLTFNGTTLSTTGLSNTGFSTLVKTLTLGDSSFNGTAVFAPATPAKLYLGTGTVTDVTSAASATNTTGAIASLAITPIAATNASVTYTNASTLYIAGAPSAGANITITNPYSFYVAGGASYFGGDVSFANQPIYSGGTANGVMYLNGSKQVTTGTALTFDGNKLEIATTEQSIKITGSGASNFITIANTSRSFNFGVDATGFNIYDNTAATYRLNLSPAGNLGIGTSSPAAKLQVTGGATRLTSGGTGGLFGDDNANYLGLFASTTANAAAIYMNGQARVGFESQLQYGASAHIFLNETLGSELMRILNTGNVGIGTSSPLVKLHVSTSGNTPIIGETTGGATSYLNLRNTGGQAYVAASTNDLLFALTAGATEAMRLTSTGLGIGTSSPRGKLDVNGNTYLGANSGSISVILSGDTTTTGGFIYEDQSQMILSQVTAGPIVFRTTNTERMRLDSSGNLGLGTNSPAGKLDVNGTVRLGSLDINLTTANSAVWISGSDFGIGTFYSNSLKFLTSNTERMRLDSSGNLLVGTTTSAAKLTVSDTSNTKVGLGVAVQVYQATEFSNNTNGFYVSSFQSKSTTGDALLLSFGTEVSYAERGSVTYNRAAGLVAYNTTSDYRSKDISGPVVDSGALIDSVPVYMGKMKGATQERPMFIAHETPSYAHTGEKDAVDKDGNPVFQQMDASALVPVLWAELQSLRARVASLESK